MSLIAIAATLMTLVGTAIQFLVGNAVWRIRVGIIAVVILGATGQIFRGVGEQRKSTTWKAVGYYCGAAAYTVTAFVALRNGLPRLLT